MAGKKSGLPPYCNRKGRKQYIYFERKDYRVRLPEFDHPDFWPKYERAMAMMPSAAHLAEKARVDAMPIPPEEVAKYFAGRQAGAKQRAKKSGREYSLPRGWAAQKYAEQYGLCAISGLTMQPSAGRFDFLQPSIDRINSALGYTTENCHLVAFGVNVAKGTMDLPNFVRLCRSVVLWSRRTESERFANVVTESRDVETPLAKSATYATKEMFEEHRQA